MEAGNSNLIVSMEKPNTNNEEGRKSRHKVQQLDCTYARVLPSCNAVAVLHLKRLLKYGKYKFPEKKFSSIIFSYDFNYGTHHKHIA